MSTEAVGTAETGTAAPITVERTERGIATIVLSRPATRNAFDWTMWQLLDDALRQAEVDDEVRAVVVRGAGGAFSSGGDLKTSPSRGSGSLAVAARLELAQRVITRVYRLTKPVVAAVEGYAIGVGWSVTMACDLVIAAEDSYFAAPFMGRGLVPDGGAAWFLARRLGRQRATSVLLGERLSATDAAHAGLVAAVTPHGDAAARAMREAARLAEQSADALRLTRTLLRQAEDSDLEGYLRQELHAAALALSGPDAAEGRRAFADRRTPTARPDVEPTN